MKDVQIADRLEDGIGILEIDGEMRLDLASRLLVIGERLVENGARHVLVDLGGVSFMDSASLGVLIRLDADLRKRGGTLVLCDVPPQVRRLLDVAGLAERFRQAADVRDGRAALE